MKRLSAAAFTATRPWGSQLLATFEHATVRIHWTDQPYRWHVNDGDEVFVVLDGTVTMERRVAGKVERHPLAAGDVVHIDAGEEHRAIPCAEARVLVVERAGSP